jgi:hypothetical protein
MEKTKIWNKKKCQKVAVFAQKGPLTSVEFLILQIK